VDLGSIGVPPGDGRDRGEDRQVSVLGVGLTAAPWWSLLISYYGSVLPLILYVTWVSVAMWDLVRRDDLSAAGRLGWMAMVLLLPLAGPVAYFAAGRSPIPAGLRAMLVGGGLVVYLLVAGLGFLVGSS
jgi:hypothetical protein